MQELLRVQTMELIKLPLHKETKDLLKRQGIVFTKDDETFYFRGEMKDLINGELMNLHYTQR